MDNPWYIAFAIPAIIGGVGVGIMMPGVYWIIREKQWGMFWWGIGLLLVGAAALTLAVHLSPYRHTFWAG